MTIIDISIQVGNIIPPEESIWQKFAPSLIGGVISFGIAFFVFSRYQLIYFSNSFNEIQLRSKSFGKRQLFVVP
jgi:hypothetical protein